MMRYLQVATARGFVSDVLRALGASESEASLVTDVLVTADRFGIDTHGIARLGYYVTRIRSGVTRPGAPIEVVRETPTTAVVDGGHGLGPVVAATAMTRAMDKARAMGLGAVAVRNSTHFGIAGYYPWMAVKAGLVGVATSNARPAIAPTRGTAPLFGTNPLAVGAPSDDERPFLFDASMAQVQRGQIEVRAREGRPLPEGWAIDAHGRPVCDPHAVLRGLVAGEVALLPLGGAEEGTGGHKGYGLSMVVEILSAALAGGPFLTALAGSDGKAGDTTEPYRTGHFFLALDPGAFVDPGAFRRAVGDLLRELRASRRRDPDLPILTAGERELDTAEERDATGIPLSPSLVVELRTLRDELGLIGYPELDPPTAHRA
jgi:LDH2 family malate/lactate/ureidoglycolate dehydrogenase